MEQGVVRGETSVSLGIFTSSLVRCVNDVGRQLRGDVNFVLGWRNTSRCSG